MRHNVIESYELFSHRWAAKDAFLARLPNHAEAGSAASRSAADSRGADDGDDDDNGDDDDDDDNDDGGGVAGGAIGRGKQMDIEAEDGAPPQLMPVQQPNVTAATDAAEHGANAAAAAAAEAAADGGGDRPRIAEPGDIVARLDDDDDDDNDDDDDDDDDEDDDDDDEDDDDDDSPQPTGPMAIYLKAVHKRLEQETKRKVADIWL